MPAVEPRPLIPADEIAARLRELGGEITRHYAALSEPLTVVALLKGSLYFAADLTREIDLPLELECLSASSYGDGTESSGRVECQQVAPDLRGRHLLLLDDIFDTGLTLTTLRAKLIAESRPLSLRTAVLLRKTKPDIPHPPPDWIGFEIEDHYVIGYGLDHAQKYRNLRDLCILEA